MDPTVFLDGRRSAIKILLILYDHASYPDVQEGMSVQDVFNIVGGSKLTTTKRIQDLIDEGLIRAERDELVFPFTKTLYLTERGTTIAGMLNQLREL